MPSPQRLGEPPVARDDADERLHERVRSVQRRAAVDAGVEVALAGPQRDVEVDDAARRDVERRHVAADHAAVEDDRRVGAALVGREEVDDRVPAGLLLAVAAEADVDRQLAGLRELARGGEQHVELALVVDGAARRRGSRRESRARTASLSQSSSGVGRLHVEVPVTEHGRRLAAARGADLADRERLAVPVDELGLAAGRRE